MGDETMNDRVTFSFGTGVDDEGSPALQAIKLWQEDGVDREARRTIDVFGMSEEAEIISRELNAMLRSDGLQDTLRLAEDIALGSGQLQPDGERLFTDGPPDPFTADVERESDSAKHFRDAFAEGNSRLLEPLDPVVNYSFDLAKPDPFTMELRANKWWFGEDGALRRDGLTVNSYSLESFEFERESEREIAAMDREDLEQTYREEGLEASMREAEAMAVAHRELDSNREDGRLFRDGPRDRFTTLREAELAGREREAAVPERDEWQELLDRANNDQPEPERHYWQMHHRPVETPDGEPLGTTLVMIEFPQLTPDFGAYLEEYGMDDSICPTEARRLELAHFPDEAASRKFEAEFRSYLVPGVLDGPELAPEVAKLEGLPGMWEEMVYQDISAYMSGNWTVVREETDWLPHSPHAEREAQERFESVDLEL